MRILNLIPTLSGGGAERQLSYLAPELVRRGHEVHIGYSRNGSITPELPGVTLHQLKSQSNYSPSLLWQLAALIGHVRPDIIHTWILQMDILGGLLAKLSGTPWILREPNQMLAYPSTLKNRMRVWIGSQAHLIVANSHGGEEYWKKQVPHIRSQVIPNRLSVADIDSAQAELPRSLSNCEAPLVLYAGRMLVDKRPATFLRAMARVKAQQRVVGVLCGQGPLRKELESLRAELGLEADVHFIDYLPSASLWSLMKRASVFVSLSAFEGCPNTVMEAMVCSCPLVVSDIPAHQEILDERSAMFVDPTDIQQTAEAIIQALRATDAAQERAQVAREKAQNWTIAALAQDYERVYQELI